MSVQASTDNAQHIPTGVSNLGGDLRRDLWLDQVAIEPEDLAEARYELGAAVSA